MRAKEAASLLVATLLAVIFYATAAIAADDVSEELKADYQNKTLTLRHFFEGDHLSFAADGTLIGSGKVGPWTLDGKIQVQNIELREQTLRIDGRRVCVVFDKKDQPYRDVVEFLNEKVSNPEEREKAEEPFVNRKVSIEIALGSGPEDEAAKSAMETVFLKAAESIAAVMPYYWRDYFDRIEGLPISVPHSGEPVFRVGGGISPPRVLYQSEPEFSEDARKAKYHGTMTLSLVVDASGKPTNVRITTPLGLGLDEKAVAAIRTWKFEPAMKGADAVPVVITVEVNFHLY